MLESMCQSFSMDFFEEPTADSTASQRGSRCFDLALVKRTGKEANGESKEGRGSQTTEKLLFSLLKICGPTKIDENQKMHYFSRSATSCVSPSKNILVWKWIVGQRNNCGTSPPEVWQKHFKQTPAAADKVHIAPQRLSVRCWYLVKTPPWGNGWDHPHSWPELQPF